MAKKWGNKRCRFYDDSGNPIKGGCHRGSECAFLHPGDEGWARGVSTWDDRVWPYSRPTNRDYSPPGDRYRRDRRTSRRSTPSHSRSRSPRHTRYPKPDSVASSIASERPPFQAIKQPSSTTTPAALPTPPTTSKDPTRNFSAQAAGVDPPPIRMSAFYSPVHPPTGPKALRTVSAILAIPQTPTTPAQVYQSPFEMNPPPPPPNEPAPMPPPLPLPEIPDGLIAEPSSTTVEIDVRAKMALWDARIKTVTKCADKYEKLASLEEQYSDASHVMQSQFFSLLPELEKTRIKDQFKVLGEQRDEAKKEFETAKVEILDSNSWPTAPSSTAYLEDDVLTKHQEILDFIKNLHMQVAQMVKVLGDFAVPAPPVPLFLSESSDENDAVDDEMDVDQPNPKSRKRRRIDDNPDDTGISQLEQEALLEKLSNYEDKLATLFNDLDVHEDQQRDIFDSMIEVRVEEVTAEIEEARRGRAQKRKERNQQVDEAVENLDKEVRSISSQVEEIAGDLASMIKRADDLAARIDVEKKERQAALERLSKVEKRLQEYTTIQQTQQATIITLKTNLHAHMTRPPSPPLSPKIPSPEYIMSTIEDRVKDSMRMNMIPMVETLRTDMESLIEEKGREIVQAVWTSVLPTMEIIKNVDTRISAYLSEAEQGTEQHVVPGQPVSQ